MIFEILQWNVKHFARNKSSISEICVNIKPNVFCIQETWNQDVNGSNMNIPSYNLIAHKSRSANRGGVVAIYASNSTPASAISINSNLEICAARIYDSNQNYTIFAYMYLLILTITS